MTVETKICGVTGPDAAAAAAAAGARYVGFVFYPPSPRHLEPGRAAELGALLPARVVPVALSVDPDDELVDRLAAIAPSVVLQLHGGESPRRVAEIRRRAGRRVMKAVKVSGAGDLASADGYLEAADMLLFDAKAPERMAGAMPGGNALAFDWGVLSGRDWPLPWMLSGGLSPGNVGEALAVSGAGAVDVSSGVESAPGVKDPALIEAFLGAVADAARGRNGP